MLFTVLNRGGAETMVMNYYRRIDRSKVQFDFVVHRSERGAYEDEIESLGGKIYRMMPLRPWTIPQYKRQIRAFFDEHPEYRIIHGQCSESGYYFYKEAHKRGIPTIIAHAHNAHVPFDLKLPFRTWMKLRMKPYVTHRFACSEEAARWLFGKKDAQKAIVQRNAIDTEAFRFNAETRTAVRAELGAGDDTLIVGHVGRFERQKNHKWVIKVFDALHNIHPDSLLLLIGSGGPYEIETRQLVNRFGLEQNVLFLGSRSDVPKLLCVMDAFLFPSNFEGLGIALIEAQCNGLPCVISDIIPEEAIMTDLAIPLSLDQVTPEQWAKAIMTQTSGKRDRSSYANRIAKAGYDVSQNVSWLQDFYLSCPR
jgi:glycosyltransferase involved in cell wall biosynthesis